MFIKLNVIGKIFRKCKGIEKSQFYKINMMRWLGFSSFLISHRFARCLPLEPIASSRNHTDLFADVEEDEDELENKLVLEGLLIYYTMRSYNYYTYRLYYFDITNRVTRFVHVCTCYLNISHGLYSRAVTISFSKSGSAVTISEWQLIESDVWSNKYGMSESLWTPAKLASCMVRKVVYVVTEIDLV